MNNAAVIEAITYLILGLNLYITYKGLNDYAFRGKNIFNPTAILAHKEYHRMVMSGFMHGGWMHFAFNMIALTSFARALGFMASWEFLVIYFGSLLAGNALALYVHRNHSDYRAWGASGAVSGVVLAYILISPDSTLRLFFFIPMKSWLFGVLYILFSIYGTKKQVGNIGHDAHLGGAIFGVLLCALFYPGYVQQSPWLFTALTVPTIVFLYLIIKRPEMLMIDGYTKYRVKRFKEDLKQRNTLTEEEELNQLVEKVGKKGVKGLSRKEKERLDELSKKLSD